MRKPCVTALSQSLEAALSMVGINAMTLKRWMTPFIAQSMVLQLVMVHSLLM